MIDIEKNKKFQDKLNEKVLEEIFTELPESFIQFLNTGVVNFSLHCTSSN